MSFRKLILIAFIFLIRTYANSQIISIDKTDTLSYNHKAKWEGNISEGIEIDKQNTTLFDATNTADFSVSKWKNLFIFSGSERFTFSGPQDFLNTGYLHVRWRNKYKNKVHAEAYAQYQWDDKIGMKYRCVGGSNIRYNIRHKAKSDLVIGTGLLYESEKWDYEGVDTNKIHTTGPAIYVQKVKSSSYIKWEGSLSSTCNLSTALFYQGTFNNYFQPRISGTINLDAAISSHVGFGFKFYCMYDSNPIVPITNVYWSFSNSFTYKL